MAPKKLSACAALCLGMIALHRSFTNAQSAWNPQSFPNPLTESSRCNREGFQSLACDPDGVLSKEGFAFLDGVLKDILYASKPYSVSACSRDSKTPGFKVAVAVMKRMAIPSSSDAPATAKKFAKELHNAWGVGNATCSDGVLMLLSVEDRQVYISTGRGARKTLTDHHATTIINSMKPSLRRGEYDGAIQQAVVDIGLVLGGAVPQGDDSSDDNGFGWLGFGVFGGFLLFFLSGCVGNVRQRRSTRQCRSLLDKLKKDQAKALQQHRFPATTCPICLEDIQAPAENTQGASEENADPNAAGPSSSTGTEGRRASLDGASSSSSPSAPLLDNGSDDANGKRKNGDSDKGKKEKQKNKRALTLLCGHTFCESCIDQWVQNKTTCPICRKPVDGSNAPPPPKAAEQQAQRQQQQQFGQEMIAHEMAFRLTNLRRMYPAYINQNMLDNWTNQAAAGALIDWDSQRALAIDQARHNSWQPSHGSDSGPNLSGGFGGGSSFGGGGSGGSW